MLGVMNVLQLTGWWLNNPPFDKSMNVMGAVIALWFGLDLIDDSYFLHNIYLEAVDSARAPRSSDEETGRKRLACDKFVYTSANTKISKEF